MIYDDLKLQANKTRTRNPSAIVNWHLSGQSEAQILCSLVQILQEQRRALQINIFHW